MFLIDLEYLSAERYTNLRNLKRTWRMTFFPASQRFP